MCGRGRPLRQFQADVLLMVAVVSFLYMRQDSLPPNGWKGGIMSNPNDTE